MGNWNKVEEIIELSTRKVEFLKELKAFISRSTFDEINDWLDTIHKTQLFFIMLEFSKDEHITEELEIIEAYYKHNN